MGKIKCVVWDLDNTVWDGALTEGEVTLKSDIVDIIRELDKRGILQSVCSKNDAGYTMEKLKKFGIDEYFLYPQINWNPKSENIRTICKSFNFGIDAIAFVDDQQFELDEVSFNIPEVLCINAENADAIPDMDEFIPLYITEDSKNRRHLYMNDIVRNDEESRFEGTSEEFLSTLGMRFIIRRAQKEDLKRVEELTVRTHQLNSTGTVYSFDELNEMIGSDKYEVIVVQLTDKYGDYGKIGVSVIEKEEGKWHLKMLLMSCRVMSKGVGSVLLKYIVNSAMDSNVKLYADFISTDRNRIMYVTYKFTGFREISKNGDVIQLVSEAEKPFKYPDYIDVDADIEF